MYDQSRVILAGPSLLYAPLYLAKIEKLSYAYRWINFDYPTLRDVIRQEEGQHDPVYYKLLSTDQDHDVALAVADPFRLRYKNAIGTDPSSAVVVGGLIQKTCLWLVSNKNFHDFDHIKDRFNQIVVHRKEMTSYALMRALLKDQSVTDAEAEKLLFRNARVGEEHLWASRWRPRRNVQGQDLPFAYLTGDRNHAIERYSRRGFTKAFFEHPNDEYKQVLFTGLVTSQHYWTNKKEFVEELVDGIKRAIEIIYNDEKWAAECLFRDEELRKLLPGEQTELRIKDYLCALTRIEAYVRHPNLKIAQHTFDNGFAIHEKAQATNESYGILAKSKLAPAFTEVLVVSPTSQAPRTSIYYVELSASGDQPSSQLLTWAGVTFALLVSLFSLARVAATGNSSSIVNNIVIKSLAEWLAAYRLIGCNAYRPLDWGVDGWIAIAMSMIALALMLGALSELLEGKSEKPVRNSVVLIAGIAAMMTLTFTLSDWNTTVGALSNWAVFYFAVYKFARRFWVSRLSWPKRIKMQWVSTLLFINRVCHAATERFEKQNRSEPLRIGLLWKLLPRS